MGNKPLASAQKEKKMNKGQASSVFRFAVFAIILLILVFLVANFFPNPPQDSIKELRGLLQSAKAREGKSVSREVFFTKEIRIDAGKILDNETTSVSFACTTPLCAQGRLEVDERVLYSRENLGLTATARCFFSRIYSCRIFFGSRPAQMEVTKTQIGKVIDLSASPAFLSFDVKNTGELLATNVQSTVKVYKKSLIEGKESKQLYAPEILDFEAEIAPWAQKIVSFNLPIKDNGDYEVEIITFGDEAGQDTKTIEFSATNAQVLSDCTTIERTETFFDETNNKCMTFHYCEKCSLSFECRLAWEQKEPAKTFLNGSKEYTVEEKAPVNGECV